MSVGLELVSWFCLVLVILYIALGDHNTPTGR